MGMSKIEWCDFTWNPITGCPGPKLSTGCAHCYAELMANTRLRGRCGYDPTHPFILTYHEEKLNEPLKMVKPKRIFVCSMGDLFHDDVDLMYIDELFAVMALCPQHEFFVLTKRVDNMKNYLTSKRSGCTMMESLEHTDVWTEVGSELAHANDEMLTGFSLERMRRLVECFEHACTVVSERACLPNVRLMTTVCNQEEADRLLPTLLSIPGGWKFGVSVEPMLGPVDLRALSCTGRDAPDDKFTFCSLTGVSYGKHHINYDENRLDWVICGGETGPKARPMHPDWVRGLRDQCAAVGTPFFFKGWGEWKPTNSVDWYRGKDNVDFVQKYGRTGREFPLSEGRAILRDGRICLVDPPLKCSDAFRSRYSLPDNYMPDGRNIIIDRVALGYAHKNGLHNVGYEWMYATGKIRSGRLLDGREWNEVPS